MITNGSFTTSLQHKTACPVPNDLFELLENIFADDKDNFIKSCFFRIMNGIIHDNLSVWSHLSQLFDSFFQI